MIETSAFDPRRPPGGPARPLSSRARSHIRAAWLVAALCLGPAAPSGCDAGSSEAAASPTPAAAVTPAAKARIEELRQAFVPLPPTATSDKQYAWGEARRAKQLELEQGPPELAPAALEAFEQDAKASDEWRTALLSVAARTGAERARPVLERLTLTYDSKATLGVRTEAMRLWCEVAPAAAVKALEPILVQPRAGRTYPPKEQMLRRFVAAARAIRQPIDATLATIATDLEQAADVRYVAVDELGTEARSARGRKALEAVLVESGSDGLLRRKAAKALRESLPRDELCALLNRVAERESDPTFIYFLADMLDKNCR